ncbi:hypothetical protein Q8F55_003619 [Vanrija albida]|uniref:Xylanolytic transcriptional activator regulatory domain-containing protein n=1 Tax=Vanrija albida TaxID=181172 RepID=A0ABR3Q4H2_9TREE
MPARRATATASDGSPITPEGGKEKQTFGCAFPGCGQDRNSHSPLPPVRAHPSVPISSSRTSEREASPIRGGRKHPRNSEGSSGEHPSSRPRLSPASDDEDEDRYGSRYSRNGMGNGGVFGVTSNYHNGNPVSTDSLYSPHLLFQSASSGSNYHNLHDSNHLEDASVLLSMAYPGGVPASDNGQATIGTLLDGDTNTTADAIAAVTTSASNDNDNASASGSNFNSGAVENPARPAAPGAVLPESMGNFAGTMNWLANGVSGNQDADTWSLTDPSRPLSPFNISSLFSPSAFGVANLPSPGALLSNDTTAMAIAAAASAAFGGTGTNDQSNNNDAVQQANQVVSAILEQLAANETPETKANPNPERPLLRLASKEIQFRSGAECPTASRFYLPADRFAGCYQIPHWALPPLRTLSVMAARTYYSVLNHFPFVHTPTFQLIDTAACLAFAICTAGGIRTGLRKADLVTTRTGTTPVISAGGAWEGIVPDFSIGVDPEEEEDRRRLEEWDAGQIVRHEKTNMLVKSFSLAKGVLMTEYNVALLQALILYHAPYFLSPNDSERRHANMFLGTIVNITRQIGFFQSDLEHAELTIQVPSIVPYTPSELERSWKRWIQLECRRRTSFLVYHLDMVSALESGIPCILSPSEIGALPLPAPDSVWKAETAAEWLQAVQTYQPISLDEAMRRTFFLPTTGAFDAIDKNADTKRPNWLSEYEYGAFARTAIIMTLVRGIVDLGEGKRDHGDWRDLTDLWIGTSYLKPSNRCLSGDGRDIGHFSQEALRNRFALALQRWREGWDFDSQCSGMSASNFLSPFGGASSGTSPGSASNASTQGKTKLVYCEEAMPFYFLAHSLLSMLIASSATDPGHNAFANLKYNDLLEASRTLARAGDGIPVAPQAMF